MMCFNIHLLGAHISLGLVDLLGARKALYFSISGLVGNTVMFKDRGLQFKRHCTTVSRPSTKKVTGIVISSTFV